MSDKDVAHTINELREARAEIDKLRAAILKHKQAMSEYRGAFYDEELWLAIGPLPGEGGAVMSEDDPAFYWEMMFKNLIWENSRLLEQLVKLEDLNRWRNAHTEPPTLEGRYIVATCRNNIGSWSDNYWENDRWEIEPVDYWKPIGPLPGGE